MLRELLMLFHYFEINNQCMTFDLMSKFVRRRGVFVGSIRPLISVRFDRHKVAPLFLQIERVLFHFSQLSKVHFRKKKKNSFFQP